jgi:hypothetical protein
MRRRGKDEFVSSAVQAALRKHINELKEREEFRMPASPGFVWGTLFGFSMAAWLID